MLNMKDINGWNTSNQTEKCHECGGKIPNNHIAMKQNGKVKHIGCFRKTNKINHQTEKQY